MTFVSLVVAWTGLISLIQPNESPVLQQDSSRLKSPLKYGLMANQHKQKRVFSLVVRPAKTQSGTAIYLPVGVDERTITVRSEGKLLKPDEGYLLVAGTNQIRILDKRALASDQLTISYELLAPVPKPSSL